MKDTNITYLQQQIQNQIKQNKHIQSNKQTQSTEHVKHSKSITYKRNTSALYKNKNKTQHRTVANSCTTQQSKDHITHYKSGNQNSKGQ